MKVFRLELRHSESNLADIVGKMQYFVPLITYRKVGDYLTNTFMLPMIPKVIEIFKELTNEKGASVLVYNDNNEVVNIDENLTELLYSFLKENKEKSFDVSDNLSKIKKAKRPTNILRYFPYAEPLMEIPFEVDGEEVDFMIKSYSNMVLELGSSNQQHKSIDLSNINPFSISNEILTYIGISLILADNYK